MPIGKFTLYTILLSFLGLISSVALQAQRTIGGVINTYSKVIDQGICPQILLVADPGAFEMGQRVLLISMQGGVINESDSENFGQLQDNTLTAGLYDWSSIVGINGNEITLANPISAGYDFSQAVQLVGIPHYQDAEVTTALVPLAWNGAIGGVLALEVDGRLTLSADISASEAGFRGAVSVQAADDVCTFLTNANKYFYETGNWRGAPKGEGIIPVIPDKAYGRGPQVNGGGGSNTHNSGGGGGGNKTRGGLGGENREPSFGGCDGFFPGLGGLGLDQWPDRWFMGGGGGAGHRNNNGDASGGNGGGIVVIKAQELAFAGGNLQANGGVGSGITGDGAGGGGAGGTIILDVQNILGVGTISVAGGKGGDVNNSGVNRCMGPGGGGSGGHVQSTVSVTPILSGGLAGLSRNSTSCPESSNSALSGTDGISVSGGIKTPLLQEDFQIITISGDTTICPGSSLSLSASIQSAADEVLEYQWFGTMGDTWMPLINNQNFTGTDNPQLQIQDLNETTSFALTVSNACGRTISSDTVLVMIDINGVDPVADFTYQLDGFSVTFSNTSIGAQAYQWRIAEIPFYSSTTAEPNFTFPAYGSYEVILSAISNCGADSISQTIVIGGPPIAGFAGDNAGTSCVPLTIQWTDQSQGIYENFYWQFPGGNPATSQEPNPLVTYNTSGTYDVILIVSGALGADTLYRKNMVKVFSVPQPMFSYQINDLTVNFTSTADTSFQHVWSFGDGQTRQEKDPVYTFSGPGAYDVTLNLQNGGCGKSTTQTILVFPTGIQENELLGYLQLSPNPTAGRLQVMGKEQSLYPLDLYIFTSSGQLLQQHHLTREKVLDISNFAAGVYWILAQNAMGAGSWKVIKQ